MQQLHEVSKESDVGQETPIQQRSLNNRMALGKAIDIEETKFLSVDFSSNEDSACKDESKVCHQSPRKQPSPPGKRRRVSKQHSL